MQNQKVRVKIEDNRDLNNKIDKTYDITRSKVKSTILKKSKLEILTFKKNWSGPVLSGRNRNNSIIPNRQNQISHKKIEVQQNRKRRSSITPSANGPKKIVIEKYKDKKNNSKNINDKNRSHSVDHDNNFNNSLSSISNSLNKMSLANTVKQDADKDFKRVEYLFSNYGFVSPNKVDNLSSKNPARENNLKPSVDHPSNVEFYNPAAKSVKEYAYKENANRFFREYMEDFCKIIDKYNNDNSKGLFCLYDGHGGSQPVNYVKDRLPEVFSKFLKESSNTVEKALLFTFQKIDDELKLFKESENVGTTACIIYFQKENEILTGHKRILYCANVGDTRALLITSKEVKRLTYDHKCTDESEAERIRKIGGIIFNGRLFGQLALSRALGDHSLKNYGLTASPSINKHTITEKDRFVVMCSDGVWDVLTDSDIFQLSNNSSNSDELSKLIVNQAINKGSQDNVSCIVIKIN